MAFNKVICLGENDIFFCLPLFIGLIKTGKGFDLLKDCELVVSWHSRSKERRCCAFSVRLWSSWQRQIIK